MLKERRIFPSGEATSLFGDEQEKRKINNVQLTINNWIFLMIFFLNFFILFEDICESKINMICKKSDIKYVFFVKGTLCYSAP